jgi:hypothetical protein
VLLVGGRGGAELVGPAGGRRCRGTPRQMIGGSGPIFSRQIDGTGKVSRAD